MTFDGTDIIKWTVYICFSQKSLALSVIDAKAALVKVANVKYMHEAHAGERLIAKSDVMRSKRRRIYRSCCHKGKYERSIQRKISALL